jgi:hypothetical protein
VNGCETSNRPAYADVPARSSDPKIENTKYDHGGDVNFVRDREAARHFPQRRNNPNRYLASHAHNTSANKFPLTIQPKLPLSRSRSGEAISQASPFVSAERPAAKRPKGDVTRNSSHTAMVGAGKFGT